MAGKDPSGIKFFALSMDQTGNSTSYFLSAISRRSSGFKPPSSAYNAQVTFNGVMDDIELEYQKAFKAWQVDKTLPSPDQCILIPGEEADSLTVCLHWRF